MEYRVKKSKRKKITLTVERDGTVLVKAPYGTSDVIIKDFVNRNRSWIKEQQQKHMENSQQGEPLTDEEIKYLKGMAELVMKTKTEYFARRMGIKYKGIKITSAHKRWGSCKSDGSICYSYRCMLVPDECQDYIAVHELAHIKQFNHSKDFYAEIEKVLSDYKDREAILKNFSNYDLY
ncbi:MAG: M48 family metallopeptidase [Oscillospiraceae bacterium]|nr:M48 family metallopeptidase [Oscillospiraceae bacterium]